MGEYLGRGADVWVDQDLRGQLVRHKIQRSNVTIELLDYRVDDGQDNILCLKDKVRLNISLGPRTPLARGSFIEARDADLVPMGELTLLPTDTPVRLACTSGHMQCLSCTFDIHHYEELLGRGNVGCNRRYLQHCLDLRDPATRRTLLTLIEELKSPTFGSDFIAESLAGVAFITALRHFRAPPTANPAAGLLAWQLKRVEARIFDDPGSPPSLAELAGLARISERHLMRGYVASRGTTLGQAIRDAQLNYAKRILTQTDLPVSVVARMTGFSTGANFASAFRKATDASPKEYRRRPEMFEHA